MCVYVCVWDFFFDRIYFCSHQTMQDRNLIGFLSVFFSITLVCLQANIISAEEECINRSGRTILCYDCDSYHNPLCKHINESAPMHEHPPFKTCKGCCVKIVEHRYSPKERVRRMCTEQLIVNYFIVDHVCLKEGNKRKGMTCFCEEDFCNSAISIRHRVDLFWAYLLGLVAAVHLLLRVG
ncbi:hypothetical protein DAPPUDRAFT_306386 [Daphnia pulex]|uniref:UPAR/Ly6 domain-containing protein qvr n=1 Tax=Daphnia pulex TaxID=6669 RepID=E9FYF2_DAPPU|nr:hypothetical protein DAPPUDRAFT_306386 [Daphnia pulex]|eukprot:EFX87780.1 hypothetical protein DAPPUDRAFT_306386 [Daphnia pulex]